MFYKYRVHLIMCLRTEIQQLHYCYFRSLFEIRLKMFMVCQLMIGMPDNDCVKQ